MVLILNAALFLVAISLPGVNAALYSVLLCHFPSVGGCRGRNHQEVSASLEISSAGAHKNGGDHAMAEPDRSAKSTGRIIGLLVLLQLAGLIVPFVLLLPLTTGPQNALANAAGFSAQIRVAVFLLFANCALTIGIAIAAFRVFRQYSEAMALWLLIASVVMFLLQAIDNVHVLSMLSLSQQYAQAADQGEFLQTLATAVGATRRWAHLTELLAIDCWIFLFYSVLYRFVLVPRAVAVFGLITVALHFAGIPLRGFLGYGPIGLMGVPMALSHIALATWLIAKGFDERERHTAAAD